MWHAKYWKQFFEFQVMKDLIKSESRFASWSWCEEGFEDILTSLRSKRPEDGFINESSGKLVWHLKKSADGRQYDFAYKINPGKTPWRYILKPSLAMREALNYRMFEELGIPVAHVLAVGDVRKNFILKENFIVTSFIDASLDGRCFMPGGKMQYEAELRFEFTLRNMELLAKIHDSGIFHKAFHPRNLLWKGNLGNIQVYWIDVARCRRVKGMLSMKKAVLTDLHTFLCDMRPTRMELEQVVEHYLHCRKKGGYPGGVKGLIDDLYGFSRRLFSSRRYVLTR